MFLGFSKTFHFSPIHFCTRSLMVSSSKIVVEYAKSGRSSCKKCSNPITESSLRLGSVTRDARGFDMTRWYHLNCWPTKSQRIESVESINGYSLLEPTDQEAVKIFVEKPNDRKWKADEDEGEAKQGSFKKIKASKDNEEEESIEEAEVVLSDSDVKNDYRGIALMPKWKAFQTVIFLEKDEGPKDSSKIAAFDFDGCLAKTSVRKVGAEHWSLMYSTIPEKLKKLYEDGYKVVIFTNEANIELWKNKRQAAIDSKVGRLNSFIKRVEVPIQVFVACGHKEDGFRKPKTGMWRLMEKYFNSYIKIDMDESFYVGDAAGRVDDHGDADIKFAQRIGLKFYLPEDYFGA